MLHLINSENTGKAEEFFGRDAVLKTTNIKASLSNIMNNENISSNCLRKYRKDGEYINRNVALRTTKVKAIFWVIYAMMKIFNPVSSGRPTNVSVEVLH